jgi:hypothetical protein
MINPFTPFKLQEHHHNQELASTSMNHKFINSYLYLSYNSFNILMLALPDCSNIQPHLKGFTFVRLLYLYLIYRRHMSSNIIKIIIPYRIIINRFDGSINEMKPLVQQSLYQIYNLKANKTLCCHCSGSRHTLRCAGVRDHLAMYYY